MLLSCVCVCVRVLFTCALILSLMCGLSYVHSDSPTWKWALQTQRKATVLYKQGAFLFRVSEAECKHQVCAPTCLLAHARYHICALICVLSCTPSYVWLCACCSQICGLICVPMCASFARSHERVLMCALLCVRALSYLRLYMRGLMCMRPHACAFILVLA